VAASAFRDSSSSAMWLAHWRGWQGTGVSMAEYARREGFDADAAYRWRRVLRRTGKDACRPPAQLSNALDEDFDLSKPRSSLLGGAPRYWRVHTPYDAFDAT